MDVFHEGERKVQAKLGVSKTASLVGRMVQLNIEEPFQFFMESQPFVIIGSTDKKGFVWSSFISGNKGFIQIVNNRTVRLEMDSSWEKDVLFANLKNCFDVGMIFIDFRSRARIRVNGSVTDVSRQVLEVTTEQVYGNCPKYIQSRMIKVQTRNAETFKTIQSTSLTSTQQQWIESADTFFISSSSSKGKTDASHRGGQPGFVHVVNEKTIQFPDYVGNMMFNTLGNIIENRKAGLLFIQFELGHTLQLTGEAQIIWELSEEEKIQYPGAKRIINYHILQIIENRDVHNYSWDLIDYSPFNPRPKA